MSKNRAAHILVDAMLAEMDKREPRDEQDLTSTQRNFLRRRLFQVSDRAALDEIHASMADFIRWQDEDGFARAYRALVPRTTVDQVKAGIDAILPDALDLMVRAIKGEELSKSQRWVVDKLLKVAGLERLLIDTTHTTIPFEARLALTLSERGVPLPPGLQDLMLQYFPDRFRELAGSESYVDAEVRVLVEPPSNPPPTPSHTDSSEL